MSEPSCEFDSEKVLVDKNEQCVERCPGARSKLRRARSGQPRSPVPPLPAKFSDLKEADFKPLDFVEDQQAIVFPDGTTLKLTASQTTFVSEGTLPEGGTWSLMPMPPTLLGPW